MEVHFTPEQEAKITQIASSIGTDPEALVKDATMRLLNEDARFRAAVLEGKAYAGRGEFVEEEEMDRRFGQPPSSPQEAAARIRELQKHVKPDPEGWTVKDYINFGRP